MSFLPVDKNLGWSVFLSREVYIHSDFLLLFCLLIEHYVCSDGNHGSEQELGKSHHIAVRIEVT
jgi:hypothetical protein